MVVEYGLEKEELAEFNSLISGILIPELMRIADKYNIDRDSMVKFTADTLAALCELSTFGNWKGAKNERKRRNKEA